MPIKDYAIIEEIGNGGMSRIYHAFNLLILREVALKKFELNEERFGSDIKETDYYQSLFDKEARLLEKLKHPQIPELIEFFIEEGELDDQLYIAMELISGESLEDKLVYGYEFSEAETVKVAHKVLDILDYLHSFIPAIIHRDVNPKNLIECEDDRIMLVDFGIATYKKENVYQGIVNGTAGFIAPEEMIGESSVQSDIYSLGVTMADMLSGGEICGTTIRRGKININEKDTEESKFAFIDRQIGMRSIITEVNASEGMKEVIEYLTNPYPPGRAKSVAEARYALRSVRV
jgi:serine/threonine protein kinase